MPPMLRQMVQIQAGILQREPRIDVVLLCRNPGLVRRACRPNGWLGECPRHPPVVNSPVVNQMSYRLLA